MVAVAYAVCVWGVVMAPAVVVHVAGDEGAGAGAVGNADLLCVAAAMGAAAAVLGRRRLGAVDAAAAGDRWIAALGALVVLAVAATAFPVLVLHLFTGPPAGPGRAALLRGTALSGAVLCAEATRGRLLRWLEPVGRRTGVPAGGVDDEAPPTRTHPGVRARSGHRGRPPVTDSSQGRPVRAGEVTSP